VQPRPRNDGRLSQTAIAKEHSRYVYPNILVRPPAAAAERHRGEAERERPAGAKAPKERDAMPEQAGINNNLFDMVMRL